MKRKYVVLISILTLATATYVLGWSTLFTVSSVEITGTRTILNSGVVRGEKLARVEPRTLAAKFEELDWVESAKISRNWINGKVTIDLVERVPIALFNNRVLDVYGENFALNSTPRKSLIEIQAIDIDSARKAVLFYSELPKELQLTVKVIKVHGTGSFTFEVINNSKKLEIIWGNNSNNLLKARVYNALIALKENAHIKRVDVSAPHAPIVK